MADQPFRSNVLQLEQDGSVATLWLDRPEARNAMGPELWQDLPAAMDRLDQDPEVRAVVIAARGPHFCVGLDLKVMLTGVTGAADDEAAPPRSTAAPTATPPTTAPPGTTTPPTTAPPRSTAARAAVARREIRRLQDAISSVARCRVPVIAAVHGACIGGGVDLIAACDIRLASADAIFSVREARVAIVADLGSLQRLPRIIGAGHTAELAYTAKDITAARAREIGLVNDVAPDADAVVHAAQAMAREIAANAPLAVQGAKAVLAAGDGRSVQEGLEYVATWNASALDSDDLREAATAFLERRPPRYTGR